MNCPHWHLNKLTDLQHPENNPKSDKDSFTAVCSVCRDLFTVTPVKVEGRLGKKRP